MLDAKKIAFFKANGYLILRDAIPAEDIHCANEMLWELLPPNFERSKPETWTGEVTDCCKTQDLEKRRGRVKYRNCLWNNKRIYDIVASNTMIREAIGQLIGDFAEPERIRGLYPTFPTRSPKPGAYPGHADKHIFQVGVIGYLSDVDKNCGATSVYPGSHRILYHANEKELERSPKPEIYEREIANLSTQKPVELTARAGSAILYHYRLFHGASYNLSNRIREAILGDFCCKNKEFIALQPTQQNMWSHWKI